MTEIESPAATEKRHIKLESLKEALIPKIRSATPLVVEIGTLLSEARQLLPHGDFLNWCQVELGLAPRRAQMWMAHAAGIMQLGPAALQLSQGALSATRRAPRPVQDDVLAEANAGNPPGRTEVERRSAAYRGSADNTASQSLEAARVTTLANGLRETLTATLLAELSDFCRTARMSDIRSLHRALSAGPP
jgi:hypothetical protein